MFTAANTHQFGGPKGKKYKYKQLQELLIQVKSKPINTIPSLLNSVFEKWKGSLEQVDDVIIVGVKV
jgi:sigma-B regulation protein RsbU (phosphoserine phosphatase)